MFSYTLNNSCRYALEGVHMCLTWILVGRKRDVTMDMRISSKGERGGNKFL